MIGYVVVSVVVSSLLPPSGAWSTAALLIDVLFTLAWYIGLLRLLGRPERTVQTLTAMFGLQAVLAPPLIASQWLMRRFGQDSDWQLAIAFGGLVLVIWLIAALQSRRQGGARMVDRGERRAGDPADRCRPTAGAGGVSGRAARLSRPVHVHILGICGTFMGGIAAIARAAGHRVTGSDRDVYPPMSTQLEAARHRGDSQGYEAAQLDPPPMSWWSATS